MAGYNNQLKNGALGNADGTWKQGVTAINATMPSGTAPTVVVQSLYIHADSVIWAAYQSDPGVASNLVVTAKTNALDSVRAGVTPTKGSVTIKAYGTLGAAAAITVFITEPLSGPKA